jgi:ComF family protein
VGSRVLECLVGFFYPAACPACLAASGSDALCAACARSVRGAAGLSPPEVLDGLPVFAACRYAGVVQELVHKLKFGLDPHPAAALGGLLLEAVLEAGFARAADAVVPVPLSRRRLRRRGFNQAALIGRVLARGLDVPLLPGLLHRRGHQRPQADLGAAERRENVRGAFRAADGVFGRSLLLVDDVITTGHTLAEAAGALRAEGARHVTAAAVAASGWSEVGEHLGERGERQVRRPLQLLALELPDRAVRDVDRLEPHG